MPTREVMDRPERAGARDDAGAHLQGYGAPLMLRIDS